MPTISVLFPAFLGAREGEVQRCIDFTKELERSLNLVNLGILARFFPHTVAGTVALLVYLFFLKSFPKPKYLLAVVSLPLTAVAVYKLFEFLTRNIFSYCF